MARRRRFMPRYVVSDMERWRITLYLDGGLGGCTVYYRTVAKWVYGSRNKDYVPSNAEVARIGRVARDENLSSREWRQGKSRAVRTFMNRIGRNKIAIGSKKPKLKLVG